MLSDSIIHLIFYKAVLFLKNSVPQNDYFGTESIGKIMLKVAPPVMLAQLIQSLYNIVDSFFVGKFSNEALTALSVIYPMQLVMIALAVGTGVGVNTYMARKYAQNKKDDSEGSAATGLLLAFLTWAVFALFSFLIMRPYVKTSATSETAIEYAVTYGNIVCVGSIGVFLEGCFSKIHQSRGNMRRPMIAQIVGAAVNVVLDPLLIFGVGFFPKMGVAGAAIATVAGQLCAALIVSFGAIYKLPQFKKLLHYAGRIYFFGYSSIFMQLLFTVYILALNIILKSFSDSAVTVLGLYYKLQSFFFIPLIGLETCIVPVISFNYGAKKFDRCKKTMDTAFLISAVFMVFGIIGFVFFPDFLISIFSKSDEVHEIGRIAFPIIGACFLPAVFSLMTPTFFQAIGKGVQSTFLALLRQIFCLIPIFWAFSFIGLNYTWLAFPLSETITGVTGLLMYFHQLKKWKSADVSKSEETAAPVIKASHKGVIITIGREHGSSGKEIGRIVASELEIPYYYKELTALAAKESGLAREFIEDFRGDPSKQLYDLYLSTHISEHAVAAQNKIIRKIAENGSCVIVGRAADHILAGNPDLLRIFVYADEKTKIRRVSENYGDSREKANKSIRRADGARSAYYKNISGKTWGDRKNYDLMINSAPGVQKSAEIICEYAKALSSK